VVQPFEVRQSGLDFIGLGVFITHLVAFIDIGKINLGMQTRFNRVDILAVRDEFSNGYQLRPQRNLFDRATPSQ